MLLLMASGLQAQTYVPGEVLVQFQPSFDPRGGHIESDNTNLPIKMERCVSRSWNIWVVKTSTGKEDGAINYLYHQKGVLVVQLNHYLTKRNVVPNDTLFSSQWALQNTGQTGGVAGIDIDATNAWSITTGGNTALGDTIVIAVIDGGADLAHQDLNFHKNYADVPGNGIDDDHNGYIDDYHGWNANKHNDSIPLDGHGTHVCGIAGARGNNRLGISGVCWNVQIMPLSLFDYSESEIVEAYTYVYDQRRDYNTSFGARGAFVVATNSSFGTDYALPADYPLWCAMYDSMGKVGILSAAATANFNVNVDVSGDMPTTCPSDWLITVTNLQNNGTRYAQCGYGPVSIDLAAPGQGIISTISGNNYGLLSGASMSSPQVAGTIALMYAAACSSFAQQYRDYPDVVAKAVKGYILNNIDSTADLVGITTSGGRLNAYKSIKALLKDYCDTCISITFSTIDANDGQANGSIASSVTGGVPPYHYHWSNSVNDTTSHLDSVAAGTYTLTVTDSSGCSKVNWVTVGKHVGIEVINEETVQLYPNPSTGNVTLVIPGTFQNAKIAVVDLVGRIVWGSNVSSGQNILPLSFLQQGVYLLKVTDGNKEVVKKIVRY